MSIPLYILSIRPVGVLVLITIISALGAWCMPQSTYAQESNTLDSTPTLVRNAESPHNNTLSDQQGNGIITTGTLHPAPQQLGLFGSVWMDIEHATLHVTPDLILWLAGLALLALFAITITNISLQQERRRRYIRYPSYEARFDT